MEFMDMLDKTGHKILNNGPIFKIQKVPESW